MAAPITVKGEGGAVQVLTVPAEGTVRRELLDDALAKGRLKLVDDPDGVLTPDTEEPEPEGEGGGEGGPPAQSANKPEWVAWAISQGADPDEAGAATKDELVAQYGGEA